MGHLITLTQAALANEQLNVKIKNMLVLQRMDKDTLSISLKMYRKNNFNYFTRPYG